ncbi:MAG: glycosyltransferase family 4 protein [Ktedonobacterales bacterium]
MAQLLFVTQYYPPEVGADQTHLGETATRLVKLGHQVTVLTTLPNYPLGIVPQEYRDRSRRHEIIDGVRVIRVWSHIAPNKGFLPRILAQLSFGSLGGILGIKDVGQPDIVIALSPPLFTGIAGRFIAWRKHCPLIFHVADIWPEAAIQLGSLRNRALIWCAESLEQSTYRHAAAIWTVTDGCRRTLIDRGVPADRIFVVRIGADTKVLRPLSRTLARAELGWEDGFVLLYVGTVGLAQGLETVLDAAEALRDRRDIRIIIVGEGSTRANLMSEASRRALPNVAFLGQQPHDRVPLLIAASDACLVTLRNLPLFQGTLPVKMYEAMAAERAVILAAEGESRQLAEEEAGAAIGVEPENPIALAQAVVHLHDHPMLSQQLGRNGRAFIEAHLDRDKLAIDVARHFEEVLSECECTSSDVKQLSKRLV